MPDLADVALPFPAQLVAQVGTASMPIPWACHNATLAWLFAAEFGRAVTGAEFAAHFLSAGPILTALAQDGVKLASPSGGSQAVVTKGSVLVFFNRSAKHSCVMKEAHLIVGYNQTTWFNGKGGDHSFSMHSTREIRWQGGGSVVGANREVCSLVAVPQSLAKQRVREIVTAAAPN
jgi:hypothetical protein